MSAAMGLNLFKYGEQLKPLPDHYEDLDRDTVLEQIREIKDEMGEKLIVLGHNYQQHDIVDVCDFMGDSYKLSKKAAEIEQAEWIVFCGVSFMAESADILTAEHQNVILPSMAAACPMAGMAEMVQVEQAWDELTEHVPEEDVIPITYMNSYADLKAFCADKGGAVCTSSNAKTIFEWAFDQDKRIFFFPDEHLGRNVATFADVPDEQQPLWNPWAGELGGLDEDTVKNGKVYLWAGNCQVHQRFTTDDVETMRANHEDIEVMVHPECRRDVIRAADRYGSTADIIDAVENAEPGSTWAIGTEFNLVDHLDREHEDQDVLPLGCEECIDCNAMAQINPSYLLWTLDELQADNPINVINVDPEESKKAKVALDRMIDLTSNGSTSTNGS
jgi:quinolinate synthase